VLLSSDGKRGNGKDCREEDGRDAMFHESPHNAQVAHGGDFRRRRHGSP
jgi:hypothetical protein